MMVDERPLAEVATIIMGTSPKGDTYNEIGEGMPLLNGPTEFGSSHPNCTLFTTDPKRLCETNDLIFCVRGSTTGRMNWADKRYALGRGVCSFRGATPADTIFIRYALEIKLNALLQFAGGSTFPNLTKDAIGDFRIPFPESRNEIVDIISKYDDLIENNKRRIELLEESARQLYKEWFVRFRFPGHEHVKIIDGVPEGWRITTLGEVSVTNALSHKAKELPEEINYIDISSVSTGGIETKNRMPAEEAPGRARRIAQHGDVIWSNVRPNLKAYALVLHPKNEDVFSTGFTVISGMSIPYSFLYNFTTTDNFVSHLVNHTTGASYPAVRPQDFERAELLLPPRPLLDQFQEYCEPNYELAYILAEQSNQLAAARNVLLPKLMSGEIAV